MRCREIGKAPKDLAGCLTYSLDTFRNSGLPKFVAEKIFFRNTFKKASEAVTPSEDTH
jgi:hypothetical protein